MITIRQGLREGVFIVLTAGLLGFVFTMVMERGLFAGPPKQPPMSVASGEVPPAMIDIAEAQSLFESGNALFVDSRHEFDFKMGHIKGSVNLPLKDYDTRRDFLTTLPKDKVLITYCDGAECNSSIDLASKLHQAGFSGVRIFFGGWSEWTSHNLPTERVAQ